MIPEFGSNPIAPEMPLFAKGNLYPPVMVACAPAFSIPKVISSGSFISKR
jgi:hypothetical protein